jgi:hypothetical protein
MFNPELVMAAFASLTHFAKLCLDCSGVACGSNFG